MTYQEITALLTSPPADARGLTRWWWYGCAVTREEIVRELDFMQAAHIGGVEVQILYPVTPDDPEAGVYNIPYGSPEFYDILKFTAEECARRGMVFDFTPGSSWPYGGPTVEVEDAQQQVIPYQLDLHGPQTLSLDFTTRFAGDVVAASLGRMERCDMLAETLRDVTENFQIKELFGWPWGTELCNLEIPEGDWKLTFFVLSQHRNHVGKPSRGAQGLVLDHCSRRATDNFLRQMVAPVTEQVQGIHALFCDSIEVEGHNWSGVLMSEFRRRRGYDLTPYIYALWGRIRATNGEDITPYVRYDYSQTMSELTIENFFDPLTDFAHKQGTLSRIQAHGTWGDILRVYAAADIPEGETFGDHRTLRVNTIHRRLASSAAHLYGRTLISNETFTWLKRPRFTETPEEMKAAVDAVFLDGMNMIVNHGYAYSPAYAGRRGWPFYASTHINHTLPWWSQYRHLADYIHRTSALLRQGHPTARVAVYLPQADIWADNMLSELHLAMRLDEHLDSDAMDGIQKAGYTFDYINDEALCDMSEISGGTLRVRDQVYHAILLVGCTRLPTATAARLADFAGAGGILIADRLPSESCGLWNRHAETAAVRQSMRQAAPILVSNRREALISALRSRLAPDVILSHPDTVGYVHRADGDRHIWFFANLSNDEVNLCADLPDVTAPARAWSMNTGMPMAMQWANGRLALTLAPHESATVVFASDLADAPTVSAPALSHSVRPLCGWILTVDGMTYPMSDKPQAWEQIDALRHFSGTGVYACRFDADDAVINSDHAMLHLSGLSAADTVILNGEIVGDVWTCPLTVSLTGHLRAGENLLEIAVSSTLINEMMATPNDGAHRPCPERLEHWPYYGTVINTQRKARLHNCREATEQRDPVPSGIWGDIWLEY